MVGYCLVQIVGGIVYHNTTAYDMIIIKIMHTMIFRHQLAGLI